VDEQVILETTWKLVQRSLVNHHGTLRFEKAISIHHPASSFLQKSKRTGGDGRASSSQAYIRIDRTTKVQQCDNTWTISPSHASSEAGVLGYDSFMEYSTFADRTGRSIGTVNKRSSQAPVGR
jgi:hypothetical protein